LYVAHAAGFGDEGLRRGASSAVGHVPGQGDFAILDHDEDLAGVDVIVVG
jgi:hypothetical protein